MGLGSDLFVWEDRSRDCSLLDALLNGEAFQLHGELHGDSSVDLYDTLYPQIVNVIFHDPATIVYWSDDTKTVVKCQPGDTFSPETGLVTAMLKKFMGNDNTFNRVVNDWLKRTGYYHKPTPPIPSKDRNSHNTIVDP